MPITGGPGTIHVAYGRRFGGSTKRYRTVALTQHSSSHHRTARRLGHEEAAPLSRRRSVETWVFDSGSQWPFLFLPALAACRSACFAACAAARSAFLASRAAVRSAL